MIKVLHTIPALDGGGADRILYDYTIRMLDEFQMDFIVHSEYEGILEKDLVSKGCRVFHVPPLHKDKREYKKRIEEIIKKGNYEIIHVSQGYRGLFFLYYAKKHGVKVRIVHSHMAYIPEGTKERAIRIVTTNVVKKLATHLFACGNDAAKWMWGEKALERGDVFIMKNAIDTKKFAFSEEKRKQIRKELHIEDKFVIGNVARFSYQKNHEFLVRIFAEVRKQREDAILMLVGRGELEDDVRKQVAELKLSDSVLFMGIRNDVPDLLNAMDLFLLPSRYEGLPVVLIEVQSNGLPALVSDRITKEIQLHKNVTYLPIDDEMDLWYRETLQCRGARVSELPFEYDIENCVAQIEKLYMDFVKER